jgi:hypothetical protein
MLAGQTVGLLDSPPTVLDSLDFNPTPDKTRQNPLKH